MNVKKFSIWILIAMILTLVLVGSVRAQDATDEPTPASEVTAVPTTVVEQPPVVVVDNGPSEDHLTWRELGLYAVVAVVVMVLGVVAYRLTTMVGNSYPPGTSTSLERAREKAQQFTQASPNLLDDLAFYLADPLVQNAIKAVKEREKIPAPPDGAAVG